MQGACRGEAAATVITRVTRRSVQSRTLLPSSRWPPKEKEDEEGSLSSPSILSVERSPIKPLTRCVLHGSRNALARRSSPFVPECGTGTYLRAKMLPAMQLRSNLTSMHDLTSTCLPCVRLKPRHAKRNINSLINILEYYTPKKYILVLRGILFHTRFLTIRCLKSFETI